METISEQLKQIWGIRMDINSAINEKGVEVVDSDPFTSYANKIREISTELPIASEDTLGGVKIGDNLTIDSTDGKLSLSQTPSVTSISIPTLANVTKSDNPTQPLIMFCEVEPETYEEGVLYLIKE